MSDSSKTTVLEGSDVATANAWCDVPCGGDDGDEPDGPRLECKTCRANLALLIGDIRREVEASYASVRPPSPPVRPASSPTPRNRQAFACHKHGLTAGDAECPKCEAEKNATKFTLEAAALLAGKAIRARAAHLSEVGHPDRVYLLVRSVAAWLESPVGQAAMASDPRGLPKRDRSPDVPFPAPEKPEPKPEAGLSLNCFCDSYGTCWNCMENSASGGERAPQTASGSTPAGTPGEAGTTSKLKVAGSPSDVELATKWLDSPLFPHPVGESTRDYQIRTLASAFAKARDFVYGERDQCVSLIADMARALGFNVGLGEHDPADKTWDEDWRTIVFIDLPSGQVSWHIHASERIWFDGLPRYEGKWDGHSTEQKYRRVLWPQLPVTSAKVESREEPGPSTALVLGGVVSVGSRVIVVQSAWKDYEGKPATVTQIAKGGQVVTVRGDGISGVLSLAASYLRVETTEDESARSAFHSPATHNPNRRLIVGRLAKCGASGDLLMGGHHPDVPVTCEQCLAAERTSASSRRPPPLPPFRVHPPHGASAEEIANFRGYQQGRADESLHRDYVPPIKTLSTDGIDSHTGVCKTCGKVHSKYGACRGRVAR